MLRVGVIGVGKMGENHARAYSELKNVKLVAVSDVNKNSAENVSKRFNCNSYEDYLKMIKTEDLDAVSIVVPTALHTNVALDVLNSGINALVEKPISDSIEGAERIIDAAKKNGVKLTVGHIERFNPAVQKLKEMIENDHFGNLISMMARRIGMFPARMRNTNIVIELAIHDIDIFSYLTGLQPKKVSSITQQSMNNMEDSANILLEYEGRISGYIQANWVTPTTIRKLNVTGTKGYAELDYVLQNLTYWSNIQPSKYKDFNEFVSLVTSVPKQEMTIQKEEPLKLELEHFINCIINNADPLVKPEESLESLKVAFEALKH